MLSIILVDILISVRGNLLFSIDDFIINIQKRFVEFIWLIIETYFSKIYILLFNINYFIWIVHLLVYLFWLNTQYLVPIIIYIKSFIIEKALCFVLRILIIDIVILLIWLILNALHEINIWLRSWILVLILIKLI